MLCVGIVTVIVLKVSVREEVEDSCAEHTRYRHHLPGILLEDLGGGGFYKKTEIHYAAECKPCMYLKLYKRSFERCHVSSGLLLATPPDPWELDM